MRVPIDEVVYFDAITSNPTTGAAADADSTPTFAVYEEATDTDIGVGGNLTKRTSLTGNYRGSFTASAANGFEAGKWYSVIVSATVSTVAGKARVMHFYCVPAEVAAGVPDVNATHVGDTSQTGRDLGASVLLSPGTGTGQVSLSSGAVTVGTNNDKTGYGLSATAVQAIWDALTSALTTVGSIGKLLVDRIDAAISSRSSHDAASVVTALGDGSTLTEAGGTGDHLSAVPDTSGTTTLLSRLSAARAGYLDNLSAGAVATASALATVASNVATILGKWTGITLLSEWLGALAGKQTANATALSELRATGAGSGGFDPATDSLEAIRDTEPLGTAMRGTDGANTTAPDNATISSISSRLPAALTADGLMKADTLRVGGTLQTAGDLAALIAALNDLGAADIRTAVGLASANLDTQLSTLATAAGLAALNNLDATAVQSACNAALVALHLDHLLGAAYDPASKPGHASALLNVLVENDGGVPRFTANALEQAPSGGGGSGLSQSDAVATSPTTGTIGEALFALLSFVRGKWDVATVSGTKYLRIYRFDDPTTVWKSFTIDDLVAPSARTPV